MTANRIFYALQEAEFSAGQGRDAARAGFLEWVICLPEGADAASEARRALADLRSQELASPAAHLFVGYLQEASLPVKAPVRRGGRRRVLH